MAVFGETEEAIINTNTIANIIKLFRDSLPGDVTFDEYILSATSDEDVMFNFWNFLGQLASTKPAYRITLTDSPHENLTTRLHRFAAVWSEQLTFLPILRPYCSSLLEKVASRASELDVWTAVAELLTAFASPTVPSAPTTPQGDGSTTSTEMKSPVLRKLHENWTNKYLPESLDALRDMIRQNESKMSSKPPFYAKTLIFVQSSGMGKSRLADAFGEECPMINFVLREEGTLGYPPADGEVLSFMCKGLSEENKGKIMSTPTAKKLSSRRSLDMTNSSSSMTIMQPEENQSIAAELSSSEKAKDFKTEEAETFLDSMTTTVRNHSIAVGLLQASFEIFNAWVEKQDFNISLKKLAAIRHEKMAPYKHESGNMGDWHLRAKDRTDFCKRVVSRAEEIVDNLIRNRDWRHAFHDDRDSPVRFALESNRLLDGLRGEADKLRKNLKKYTREGGEPLLAVVFDEASSLLKPDGSGNPDPGRYHALNRIISLLKKFPIWFFFLSTESQVGVLMPANDAERTGDYSYDPSARIAILGGTSLRRFSPFLALQLDVEDRRRMLNLDSKEKEIRKKMNDFAKLEHMALFGRPLWSGYDPDDMIELAKLKLVGGRQGTTYDAKSVHHVFAALSFRLSLDVCLQNPRTLPLARTAVNSFMRVLISMNQDTGVLDTITPSEPVVAKAAMEHLCEKDNWSDSIRTLAEELLDNGLIDKGLKGELYSRFVLILARDWLRIKVPPQFEATFTVEQFLKALYAENHHKQITLLPPGIREARMNFNHFVPAGENLRRDIIPDLLHDLLRRSAGMQLPHNQPTYDIIIPIYFGNPDEPFQLSCCGVIQIQVKNKDQATTPSSIFEEPFTKVNSGDISQAVLKAASSRGSIRDGSDYVFNKMINPTLFLLFDLGIIRKPQATSPLVQVSRSSGGTNPDVWAIHSRGHDGTVFGCLEHMGCVANSNKFFTSLKLEENMHDGLCRRNMVFSKLGRNFRYSKSVTEQRGVKRKWNEEGKAENRAEDALTWDD